ncbi:hypothetical protein MM239_17520 [Belliella sp. DSM 111904]|uniref:Uncharacterized protein n=1 Tax=Belliella filtrata TaxID=2923435 RepID=A0ABS9V463_9BACT|nr:hypothetical protein [Belliella filtrata]MCH7411200.1 hypothetical protein [Belliella filtrata]
MNETHAIDLNIIGKEELFERIYSQKQLFIDLFTAIANEFPQSILKTIKSDSKGTKVSQGWNLNGTPYQVLDIFRNFDPLTGSNIRLLNWWGNGLYVVFHVGVQHWLNLKVEYLERLKFFHVGFGSGVFDYKDHFSKDTALTSDSIQACIKGKQNFVIYRAIQWNSIDQIKNDCIETIQTLLDLYN